MNIFAVQRWVMMGLPLLLPLGHVIVGWLNVLLLGTVRISALNTKAQTHDVPPSHKAEAQVLARPRFIRLRRECSVCLWHCSPEILGPRPQPEAIRLLLRNPEREDPTLQASTPSTGPLDETP